MCHPEHFGKLYFGKLSRGSTGSSKGVALSLVEGCERVDELSS